MEEKKHPNVFEWRISNQCLRCSTPLFWRINESTMEPEVKKICSCEYVQTEKITVNHKQQNIILSTISSHITEPYELSSWDSKVW